uniref:Uncharacterized protein n=1 Tax=Rhizophora mucronata TaxID=61149 RepID=A0A2P2R2B4_RHIMU
MGESKLICRINELKPPQRHKMTEAQTIQLFSFFSLYRRSLATKQENSDII